MSIGYDKNMPNIIGPLAYCNKCSDLTILVNNIAPPHPIMFILNAFYQEAKWTYIALRRVIMQVEPLST